MLRHPGAALSCLADEIEVNIDLLGVVLFLVPPGAFMHLDAFNKLPHQFRRQLCNIRVLVHQFAEAFSVQKRIQAVIPPSGKTAIPALPRKAQLLGG